jgi:hypothetical protein
MAMDMAMQRGLDQLHQMGTCLADAMLGCCGDLERRIHFPRNESGAIRRLAPGHGEMPRQSLARAQLGEQTHGM